jgi:RNA polymerase sigma-70 factor (ECF subfamily)
MDEQDKIKLAQRGDSAALSELLHTHYPFLLKYLTKITLDPHLAEDLVQDTFIKCMHKIGLFDGRTKFSTWLITIGTRLYIDEWRKRKRMAAWQEQETALRKIKWKSQQLGDQWPDMLDALGELSRETRTAIVLKHYYGYSLEEIADMTDVPIGTVKSRIHNGIKAMRKELNVHERSV